MKLSIGVGHTHWPFLPMIDFSRAPNFWDSYSRCCTLVSSQKL